MLARTVVVPTWFLLVGAAALVLPIPVTIVGVALVIGAVLIATGAVIRFATTSSHTREALPTAATRALLDASDAGGRDLNRMDSDQG